MTLPIWFIDNIFKQNQKSVVGTSITIESPYKVAWIMGDDNNENYGYSEIGRLFAIGYIKGIKEAVYGS